MGGEGRGGKGRGEERRGGEEGRGDGHDDSIPYNSAYNVQADIRNEETETSV